MGTASFFVLWQTMSLRTKILGQKRYSGQRDQLLKKNKSELENQFIKKAVNNYRF